MQFSNVSSLIRANEYYEIILEHYNCSLEIMFHVHQCHYRTDVDTGRDLANNMFFLGKNMNISTYWTSNYFLKPE
jgi:hypothetical protein